MVERESAREREDPGKTKRTRAIHTESRQQQQQQQKKNTRVAVEEEEENNKRKNNADKCVWRRAGQRSECTKGKDQLGSERAKAAHD